MTDKAIQDTYPEELSHCYGCGRNNEHGHQLKSYWQHGESVAHFMPETFHTAIPGFVYGGLIASLIDCHGTGTAATVAYQNAGREPGSLPALRFVTGALHVDFLAPTPAGIELKLIGRPSEVKARKVVVDIEVYAGETLCARGNVIAVLMPESMNPQN
ncbi:MAG: PaaI family thioesterase [Gammaproteobacteria bacterium]|nr:PaaI family thioesterase [Gammaproteobacteria bacterium]